ncbi:hypothetical protein PGB90_008311 [Kerria lacca]
MNISKAIIRSLIQTERNVPVPKRKIHQTRNLKSKHHDPTYEPYTDVGYNLPFKIDNPYTLLIKFCFYFGSGFWLPFASYHYKRTRVL